MREILVQKLTSRKLWAAIFASALCVVAACLGEELTPELVDVLKSAVGASVAYIFGESAVDIFRQIAEAIKAKLTPPTVNEVTETEKPAEGEDIND